MKIAFVCPRSNHLKILGPVWAEARQRGHQVEAVVVPADHKGAGAMAFVQAELGGPIRSPIGLEAAGFDWAVVVGMRTAPDLRARTRPRLRWAALDHAQDNLTYLLEGASTAGWDLVTTLAEEPRAFAEGETGGYFGHDLVPIGYPELDQLALPHMTRDACRAKWNLPAGKLVVVFGTLARPQMVGRFRRWWVGQTQYWAVVRALRRWCDAHNALLVAKTRLKHGDPAWLTRYCDRVIGDQSFYPFTTLELLRAADLYVGYASALAIEASAVGLPQVHLHAWPPWRSEWPWAWPLKKRFFWEAGGLWMPPGSEQVGCWQPGWQDMLDFRIRLARQAIGRGDAILMRARAERWAGPLDGKASARFLDLLEQRC